MQKFDTPDPISAVLDIPALKNTEGTPDLSIHATTTSGDIVARSL